ncbi:phosphotransferase family protein [Paenibacillus sp. 1011MAR3C5]|uniref:phosphotransferase n=1 Tax=Paenibacillus sp. 1011MAR3C5 TaxID=1675787 RepID=UPI000E6BB27C|nr:phosphotransferase [Paenibacillus sp. 1011MAR3C5]RJE86184.1 phosphotransferase family protein [Paenibacillus sp. 1011MAR3C5]
MINQKHERALYAQIARKLNPEGELREYRALTGGVSASTTYIEVAARDGAISRYVVRQHGEADLRRDADIARHEFELLQLLKQHGVSVAQPVYYDQSSAILSGPYIVAAYLEGSAELQPKQAVPYAGQLGSQLAAIHRVAVSRSELPFLADMYDVMANKLRSAPEQLDDSLSEGIIREALLQGWPNMHRNEDGILHGDYWPGNVLWKDGSIAAVLDWEDAAWGDPLSDVGNARLELLWVCGEEAMEAFTRQYQTEMPHLAYGGLSYWDLCAALRPASRLSSWGLEPEVERIMRERHAGFVNRALANRHNV